MEIDQSVQKTTWNNPPPPQIYQFDGNHFGTDAKRAVLEEGPSLGCSDSLNPLSVLQGDLCCPPK